MLLTGLLHGPGIWLFDSSGRGCFDSIPFAAKLLLQLSLSYRICKPSIQTYYSPLSIHAFRPFDHHLTTHPSHLPSNNRSPSNTSVHLSICLHQSIIYQFICLPIHPSICPSIYLIYLLFILGPLHSFIFTSAHISPSELPEGTTFLVFTIDCPLFLS